MFAVVASLRQSRATRWIQSTDASLDPLIKPTPAGREAHVFEASVLGSPLRVVVVVRHPEVGRELQRPVLAPEPRLLDDQV